MTPLRFSRRLHDNHPGDATYACAIERFERRASAWLAVCIVTVVAIIVIIWIALTP